MIRVTQTRFGNDPRAPGNCFAACIASLLELPLEAVPDELPFIEARVQAGTFNGIMGQKGAWADYYQALTDWLGDRFGMGMIELEPGEGSGLWRDAVCILGGKSPRGLPHAVVGRGREILHDPHPDRTGLVEPARGQGWSHTYFVLLDPAEIVA